MTTDTEKTTTKKAPRKRSRKVRIEEHPDVIAWCKDFVNSTEDELGYTPTPDQSIQAFLVAALRAIGEENRRNREEEE